MGKLRQRLHSASLHPERSRGVKFFAGKQLSLGVSDAWRGRLETAATETLAQPYPSGYKLPPPVARPSVREDGLRFCSRVKPLASRNAKRLQRSYLIRRVNPPTIRYTPSALLASLSLYGAASSAQCGVNDETAIITLTCKAPSYSLRQNPFSFIC